MRRWLQRAGCLAEERRANGGVTLFWNLHSFPQALRLAIAARLAEVLRGRSVEQQDKADTADACEDLKALSQLPDAANRRAVARLTAVRAWQAWRETTGMRGSRGAARFAEAWQAGAIASPEWVKSALPAFCVRSLMDWERTFDARGASALGGDYKAREHTIDANPAMMARAEATIAEFPHINGEKLRWSLAAKFGDDATPSVRSVQRWLAAWKQQNRRLHASIVNPDAHKARFRPAFGSASEGITRLNQVWEFDDTPSDIILADGQRYAVIGMIDVWSRRLMLQVHRSSTSHGISLLMRRALLTFGVPETVRTDNGAAYVSRHITEVLKRLDVTHDILPPFSPERKPFIERALKTFAYDLVEVLPGFVGHSVAEAQALRARQTFAQRLFGRGDAVELRMSAADFQAFCDDWTEGYHGRSHGTLRTTPALRAAQWAGRIRTITDERALDVLLAPLAGGDGRRTVTKKGIRVENGLFIAPQLGDLVGETVECRQDPADAGRVYVFDDAGRFVCIAEDPDRTGVSRDEIAAAARAHAQKRLKDHRAELRDRRRTELPDPDTLARDIITARIAAAPKVLVFPRPAEMHASEGLEQSGRASRAEEAPVAPARTPADERRDAQLVALASRRRAEEARDPRAERNARVARGLAAWDALNGGAAIPETERAWFEAYETTTEFLSALSLARGIDIRRGHYRSRATPRASSPNAS
ncbi:Mu transposase C-terminal domain-containing protein [Elioraea sp.]|uniref:Mu transposase C-terminal domain-containing protein n=1 Tax=Elioraea sp. TaxID=2185103 RepID=UPI0025C61486|nr:Mu transposase C-terminal domain-containing protein [Elioraea sp.]